MVDELDPKILPMREMMIRHLAKEMPGYTFNYNNFVPGGTPIYYSGPYWDNKETEAALRTFLDGKWLTTGQTVYKFQNIFSRTFNVDHSHMVNSGSSANLVLITALKKYFGWQDGDEIIVSPVGFPTTIAPIAQNNLKPVFCDIEMDTLNFDLDHVEKIIIAAGVQGSKIKAIFVSPVLGNPPDMDRLKELCDHFGILLIGDNCDSLGSRWNGKLLNEYYYAWTTSFYPAHHITTGEGGMVCTNDEELAKLFRSISWWGRDCHCVGQMNLTSCGTCGTRFSKWLKSEGVDEIIDHKYVFTNMGYNLKPLDLQGAIGVEQLKKVPEIERKRREHFQALRKIFSKTPGVKVALKHLYADPCWFGVPLICDNSEIKRRLVEHLEENLIQTRNYFAGNILVHPGYKHLDDASKYPNANRALSDVFFVGCPPHYNQAVFDYFKEVVDKFNEC